MQSVDFVLQHTLLNTMRTGDSSKDAIIGVVLFSLAGAFMAFVRAHWTSTVVPKATALWQKFLTCFTTPKTAYVQRIITRRYNITIYGDTLHLGDGNERHLQNAIDEHVQKSGIKFTLAHISLKPPAPNKVCNWVYCLLKYKPAQKVWQRLNEHVELYIVDWEEPQKPATKDGQLDARQPQSEHTCEYQLRSESHDHIDAFLAAVWTATAAPIIQEMEANVNVKLVRYYHMLTLNYGGMADIMSAAKPGTETTGMVKRPALFDAFSVPLNNNKTFDSMFFPGKEAMLAKLDDFMGKTCSKYKTPGSPNKFNVPGCPRKLGFLLHGPPGTGKTSFARALAEYTGRSIVTTPLDKIRHPEHVFKFFHDLEINTMTDNSSMVGKKKISVQDIIILVEEVDCVKALHQRSIHPPVVETASDSDDFSDDDTLEKTDITSEKTDIKDTTKGLKSMLAALMHRKKHRFHNKFMRDDGLDIDAFLTALDGVVSSPGRLLVFTTNHPEKLDRALLRPGRIDMQIEFTYMTPDDMAKLICLYFSPDPHNPDFDWLSADQRGRLVALKQPITPAELENECASDGTLDNLLTRLEAKWG